MSLGYTNGDAEVVFRILVLFGPLTGVHKTVPLVMFTCNINVSILQIRVSLKGRLSTGLSRTFNAVVTVSIHPTLLATINFTWVVTGAGYFQAVSFDVAVSFEELASPKSHKRLLMEPYFVLEVSLNK